MEYPTTNLIPFPAQDPNPPVPLKEVLKGTRQYLQSLLVMTPERAARLAKLKAALGIPQSADLGTLTIAFLDEALKQKTECAKCQGRRNYPCKKVVFDETWQPTEIPCPQQAAVRAAAKAQKLMTSARIPARYRDIRAGKDFRLTAGNRKAACVAESCISSNAGLYVYGAAGVGKTMLACVIANERARLGKPSLFITVPDMLEELRDFVDADRRAAKIKLLYETPCLIIDDLGAEKATAWAAEQLFRVFNARYNAELQTIVTSNFALDQIETRLPDYAGERVVRRIQASCTPVFMER